MQDTSTNDGAAGRLRGMLRLRNMSIKDFSNATTIPYRTLQNYLASKAKPSFEHLRTMSNFGIDIDYLLTGNVTYPGFLLEGTKPLTDDEIATIADMEVRKTIEADCQKTINLHIANLVKENKEIDFSEIFHMYMTLIQNVSYIFARSKPPIQKMRKFGMPISDVVRSVADASLNILAAKLEVKSRETP